MPHWKPGVAMMSTLSLLVTLGVLVMTTSRATYNGKVGIMPTLVFRCGLLFSRMDCKRHYRLKSGRWFLESGLLRTKSRISHDEPELNLAHGSINSVCNRLLLSQRVHLTWYCIQHSNANEDQMPSFYPTKVTSNITLLGKLWIGLCQYIVENCPFEVWLHIVTVILLRNESIFLLSYTSGRMHGFLTASDKDVSYLSKV